MRNEELSTTCRVAPAGEEKPTVHQWRWVKPLLLVILVGAMTTLAWTSNVKEWLDPNRLILLLQGLGLLAPIVYMFIMAGAVVISPIPSIPLDAAAGAVFGPLMGTLYSVLGAGGGALISFFIARTLGKEAITRWLKSDIGFCQVCTERHLFLVILLARLLPVFSFDLVSYGAGLTRISTRGFAVATLLGMIPSTFVFNYFGSEIFSGSSYPLFLGGLIVVLSLLAPKWIKRYNPWGLYDRLEKHERSHPRGAPS